MALDRNIRLTGIHAGPAPRKSADFIAHRIFNFESDEIETGERTLRRRDIDPDGACRLEPIGPRQAIGGLINIVLRPITTNGHLPEDAAGDAGFEIGPVAEGGGGAEVG